MIVVDASAMVEALVGRDADPELIAALAGDIAVPQLLDFEVLSALRGLTLGARLTPDEAEQAWRDYSDLNTARHDAAVIAERVWALRHQYTAHDASYIALAEGLDAPLLTCDRKLVAGGHNNADVRVFPLTGSR